MKTFSIVTKDGFSLSATEFAPDAEPRATVVIAGATGVPQGFYQAIAEHLLSQGLRVITFDYRGIGRSAPSTLRGFHADYFSWGEQDLGAVIDVAARGGNVLLVGHSFGGHALALLPNQERVRAVFTFGVGAGSMRYMPFSEWPRVWLLWNVLGPIFTRMYGYLPGRMLGLGEDLPLGVYQQWKRWCANARYWFDDSRYQMATRAAAFRAPITALSADDDRWAPHASVDLFHAFFSGSLLDRVHLSPHEHGLKRITHMGFFRREHAVLWPKLTAWIDSYLTLQPRARAAQRA